MEEANWFLQKLFVIQKFAPHRNLFCLKNRIWFALFLIPLDYFEFHEKLIRVKNTTCYFLPYLQIHKILWSLISLWTNLSTPVKALNPVVSCHAVFLETKLHPKRRLIFVMIYTEHTYFCMYINIWFLRVSIIYCMLCHSTNIPQL